MSFKYLTSEVPQLKRSGWTNETWFAERTAAALLEEIVDEVVRLKSFCELRPAVIFDLDSTLFDVSHRTFQIYKEWHNEKANTLPPELEGAFATLTIEEVGYSPSDTFKKLGLGTNWVDFVDDLYQFWKPRFFTSDYLVFDRPYPGAYEFVRDIANAGALVVYLTGRERTPMQRGTLECLSRFGFPLGAETRLFMREVPWQEDHEHKVGIVTSRLIGYRVVASFENEPRNIVALSKALPQAKHVFVDTVCSEKAAHPVTGLYRISRFV